MAAQTPMDVSSAGGWAGDTNLHHAGSGAREMTPFLRHAVSVLRNWNAYSFTAGVSDFWLGASSDCRILRIAIGVLLRGIELPFTFTGHSLGSSMTIGFPAFGESSVR